MAVNHEELLTKYVQFIIQNEGVGSLNDIRDFSHIVQLFTDEEKQELFRIEREFLLGQDII